MFFVNADVLIGSVNHSEPSFIAQGNKDGSFQLPQPKVVKDKSVALRGIGRVEHWGRSDKSQTLNDC